MHVKVSPGVLATEGNKSASGFHGPVSVETTGNKAAAIRCLTAAIESFTAAHNLSREQLAEDICGMSPGNFSKVINGGQGDFLLLVQEKLPADIRRDYYERMADLERVDPLSQATEQFIVCAFRMIRLARGRTLPVKADRMASAVARHMKKAESA